MISMVLIIIVNRSYCLKRLFSWSVLILKPAAVCKAVYNHVDNRNRRRLKIAFLLIAQNVGVHMCNNIIDMQISFNCKMFCLTFERI